MRLFIAINFQENIKEEILTAAHKLQQSAIKGNYTLRENLHLTLIFLGEISQDRVGSIKTAMNRVKEEPFSLGFGKTGRFRRNGGDIYWIGIERNDSLLSVHRQLSEELIKEGFSLEEREYRPHLTVGREVKLKDPASGFFPDEVPIKSKITVFRISLMKSERIQGKLTYTEIYGRDLSK